jgi:hypothetical protein
MSYVDEQRLQGTIFSEKSCEFDWGFGPMSAILKAGGDAKRERKLVASSRRDGQPLGFTAGKFTPGKLTFAMVATTAAMLEEFLDDGNGSIGDTVFNPTVSLYEPDTPNQGVITVQFNGAVLTSWKETYDEGIDELLTEYEADFLSCSRNGRVLFSILRNQ